MCVQAGILTCFTNSAFPAVMASGYFATALKKLTAAGTVLDLHQIPF